MPLAPFFFPMDPDNAGQAAMAQAEHGTQGMMGG
jgi:hypothetical protein